MRASFTLFLALGMFATCIPAPDAPAGEGARDWRKRQIPGEEMVVDDVREEIRFGRDVAARILGRYPLYEDQALTRYVNLVGRSVALNASRPELDFRFAVLNTEEVNAYAAPGGYVFVTRGALRNMQNEAELAGVLAHEITHITERHVVKELNIKASDTSGAAGLARLIGGSSESARAAFSLAVDKAVNMLFVDGYKKQDEADADHAALILCATTGYDPSALIAYFERLSAVKKRNADILERTHPSFEKRIALLKGVLQNEGMTTQGMSDHKERFSSMRAALK